VAPPAAGVMALVNPSVHGCRITRGKTIYEAYRRWASDQGMTEKETLTATKFGRRLGERFEKDHDKGGGIYRGVGLVGDGLRGGEDAAGGDSAACGDGLGDGFRA
jgi:hypothetical protein